MADDWKPKSARALESEAWTPKSARPLDVAKKAEAYVPGSDTSVVDSMGPGQKLLAGIGGGMMNTAQNIGDIIGRVPGLSELRPDAADWEEQRKLSAPLFNDPKHSTRVLGHVPLLGTTIGGFNPGNVGNFAGEMAATAPIGAGAGGVARKVFGKLGLSAAEALIPRLAARLAPLASEGSAQGYVLGGPGHRTEGAILGGVLGGGAGALGAGTEGLARGFIKPSPAAAALLKSGVDPSVGQLNPGGVMSRLEEAGQHSILGGEAITHARSAPVGQLQDAAIKEASPMGLAPHGDTFAAKIDGLDAQFGAGYDKLASTPISSHVGSKPLNQHLSEVFSDAAADPGVLADEAKRTAVHKYLQNQVTLLDRVRVLPKDLPSGAPELPSSTALAVGGAPGTATPLPREIAADGLLKMRSNIRKTIRQKLKGASPDWDTAAMLGSAEDALSGVLKEQLPPEQFGLLQHLDRKYRLFKALDVAGEKAGDMTGGPTPIMLSNATQKADISGPLRELTSRGRDVLTPKQPSTGAKMLTLPLGLNHVAGPLGAIANNPSVKALLLGTTPAQLRTQALIDALRNGATGHGVRATSGAALLSAGPLAEQLSKGGTP